MREKLINRNRPKNDPKKLPPRRHLGPVPMQRLDQRSQGELAGPDHGGRIDEALPQVPGQPVTQQLRREEEHDGDGRVRHDVVKELLGGQDVGGMRRRGRGAGHDDYAQVLLGVEAVRVQEASNGPLGRYVPRHGVAKNVGYHRQEGDADAY